jgi:hypothetical protein
MSVDLQRALGPMFGAEFDVDASDGIGRKTETPWVRIFATSMSPTPRAGWYVVVHFAADGSAVFVTVGCGSTVWSNGTPVRISPPVLAERTSWARSVLLQKFGTLAPFEDTIRLGANALLPTNFEQATAVAGPNRSSTTICRSSRSGMLGPKALDGYRPSVTALDGSHSIPQRVPGLSILKASRDIGTGTRSFKGIFIWVAKWCARNYAFRAIFKR